VHLSIAISLFVAVVISRVKSDNLEELLEIFILFFYFLIFGDVIELQLRGVELLLIVI
jgi:hypothetical protein